MRTGIEDCTVLFLFVYVWYVWYVSFSVHFTFSDQNIISIVIKIFVIRACHGERNYCL